MIADGTDNPGGGGYNDTTPVLQALLDARIENVAFGTIYDPATVQQAMQGGRRREIEVALGGHTDVVDGRAGQGQGHRQDAVGRQRSRTTGR